MFLILVRIIRTFYQNLKILHQTIWKKKFSSLFFTQIIGCFLNRMNCYACRKSFINPSIIFDHFMLTYHFPLFFSQLENIYLQYIYTTTGKVSYVKWICTKVFTIIHKFSICLYYGRKPQLQFVCHKVSNFIRSMFSSKI